MTCSQKLGNCLNKDIKEIGSQAHTRSSIGKRPLKGIMEKTVE